MGLLLDFIIVGLSIGVVYGLVALGISLIFSGLDIVHFAHGEVYMIGAFIGIAIVSISGVPYFGALVGAMVVTGIVGVVIERVFYRRLTRGGGGYYSLLLFGSVIVLTVLFMPKGIGGIIDRFIATRRFIAIREGQAARTGSGDAA